MHSQDEIRARIRDRIENDPKLSVRGASLKAGMGETTLRNYLDGMTASLTVESVNKLAPVLGVSAQYILTGVSAQVVDLWERIPLNRRDLARTILEGLAEQK